MPTRKPELVGLRDDHLTVFGVERSTPVRGVALEVDGEVVAIGGYADHGHVLEVFSDVRSTDYPVHIYRSALLVMEWIDETRKPAYCIQGHDRAPRFLKRLGFDCLGEVNGEIIWRY